MLDNASPAGIRVNTIILAFTLIAGTVVFLRLFTRLVLTKGAGFEDVCIAIAMVCWSPTSVFDSILITAGFIDYSCCGDLGGSNAWPWKTQR
jgi:hypothetical protein